MKCKIKNILKRIYLSKWFILFIILLGIAIIIRQYIFNRSLWVDEAALALNFIKYNYLELLGPLDYNQAAPPLFLLIVNFLTNIFGYSEYVLRLIPLAAGITAPFLFWHLSTKLLDKYAVPIAVGLFSFSMYGIYYATEFKQYSVELLATLIVLISAVYVYRQEINLKSSLIFGFLGAFIIWLSLTSVFILAASTVSLFILTLATHHRKDIKRYRNIIIIGILWWVSFALNYFLIAKKMAVPYFFSFWKTGFAPFPVRSFNEFLWYPKTVLNMIRTPLGLRFSGIIILLILAGLIAFWKRGKKFFFSTSIAAFAFLITASMLHIYPILDRSVFFMLPVFYLLIAKGIEYAFLHLGGKRILVTIILLLLVFFQPLFWSFNTIANPIVKEDARTAINYYKDNRRKGDQVYVYYAALGVFRYYTRNNRPEFIEGVKSRENPEKYLQELETLDGKGRTWFIFCHNTRNEKELFLNKLEELGEKLDFIQAHQASAYLYDI